MKNNLKVLTVAVVTLVMIAFTGCGKDEEPVVPPPAPAQENVNNTTPMTKSEYEKYLSERYDYYFDNETIGAQYDMYDIYDNDFSYKGTYDEFISGYNDFYTQDKANLEAFRKDLEANVRRGDAEVDKLNDEIMTSLDKAILAAEDYGKTFTEKTKEYGTMAKEEAIKGLRDIGRIPYETRVELDKLVDEAKDRLGID